MLLVATAAGCGSGDGEIPTNAEKREIQAANTEILNRCFGIEPMDPVAIASAVDVLVREAEEAGDRAFAIAGSTDATFERMLNQQARNMDQRRCAPEQAARLRDAVD